MGHDSGDVQLPAGRTGEPGWSRQLPLPPSGHAAGLARQAARDALAAWRLEAVSETAVLLVSELVTNAIRHARTGGSAIVLTLETAGGWLRIEVHDGDPGGPVPRPLAGLEESGFGLVLVDAMADKWGVRQTASGKAVWVELDTQPGLG
ncbi:MAG TPA: ATP-binding protein [Streptosporangiaceae bacterium]